MINRFLFITALPFVLLTALSCSGDNEGPPAYNELVVDVEGLTLSTGNVTAVESGLDYMITASDGYQTVNIYTPHPPSVGTYQLGRPNSLYYAEYLNGNNIYSTRYSGTIEVYNVQLSAGGEVDVFEANFNFTGYSVSDDSTELANGNIRYFYSYY